MPCSVAVRPYAGACMLAREREDGEHGHRSFGWLRGSQRVVEESVKDVQLKEVLRARLRFQLGRLVFVAVADLRCLFQQIWIDVEPSARA